MFATDHQELLPYFLLTGSNPVLWRISDRINSPDSADAIAIAIFSQEKFALEYQQVHGLTSARVLRPGKMATISIFVACWEQGVRFAMVDPLRRSGRQLFDLRQVLKSVRQDLANQRFE